ncbi:hypothetical protein GPA19_24855 [Azoarcus indigens]|uniref:hypothetical protein n=1 Tax=Azoarcus indigens TaxID=29545 RepID=UPI00105DBB6E|nr:hypothetical protein [Azoarcus indigens]NMG68163.1 hypothetical protein [Azoarcus indigens]
MSTMCDSTTMELLRRIIGMRLERVSARCYPGYLAYDQIVAKFSDSFSIRVDLSEEVVEPKFEVFVVRARPSDLIIESDEWDRLELKDFIVASISVLRREEWVKKAVKESSQLVGQHGMEQRFGSLDSGGELRDAVVVDSGLSFISTRGAELRIDADVFPLVLQLRYEVAPSPLPVGTKIAVNEYQKPQ